MVIWAVWWEFVMGFLGEYVFKVSTPVWQGGFLRFGFLCDLGRDGDFSNAFSSQPGFPFFKTAGCFKICVHS